MSIKNIIHMYGTSDIGVASGTLRGNRNRLAWYRKLDKNAVIDGVYLKSKFG